MRSVESTTVALVDMRTSSAGILDAVPRLVEISVAYRVSVGTYPIKDARVVRCIKSWT
jgi:hypothetical protein